MQTHKPIPETFFKITSCRSHKNICVFGEKLWFVHDNPIQFIRNCTDNGLSSSSVNNVPANGR